jgi:hypothetical protein
MLFFLMGLKFELNASWLQSKYSIAWAPPVCFGLAILEMGVSQIIYLCWSETMIGHFSPFCVARMKCQCQPPDTRWLGLLNHCLTRRNWCSLLPAIQLISMCILLYHCCSHSLTRKTKSAQPKLIEEVIFWMCTDKSLGLSSEHYLEGIPQAYHGFLTINTLTCLLTNFVKEQWQMLLLCSKSTFLKHDCRWSLHRAELHFHLHGILWDMVL